MAEKKFVLRIDAKVFGKLEEWAKDEFRSINGQIEYLLHQALLESGRMKNEKPEQSVENTEENL